MDCPRTALPFAVDQSEQRVTSSQRARCYNVLAATRVELIVRVSHSVTPLLHRAQLDGRRAAQLAGRAMSWYEQTFPICAFTYGCRPQSVSVCRECFSNGATKGANARHGGR